MPLRSGDNLDPDLWLPRPLCKGCERSVYGVRERDDSPRPEPPCPEPPSGSGRLLLFARLNHGAVLLCSITLGTNLF